MTHVQSTDGSISVETDVKGICPGWENDCRGFVLGWKNQKWICPGG